jgi:transcriptional regulator with XRE-family HTH domain
MARQSFGTRLRSLRERAGLTQTELAEAVGVGQGNVATWERNAAVPDVAMVERLAVFLGVSVVEMLTGQPPNPFIPVKPRKETIRLTGDNFAAHLSIDYATSLVKGFAVPADGINPHDFIVSKLLAWVERESEKSADLGYEMSPVVAAIFLEGLASPP